MAYTYVVFKKKKHYRKRAPGRKQASKFYWDNIGPRNGTSYQHAKEITEDAMAGEPGYSPDPKDFRVVKVRGAWQPQEKKRV